MNSDARVPATAPSVDRRSFSVVPKAASGLDLDYWLAQTVEARVCAIEQQRQIVYGQSVAAARLQRVLEIAQRAPR
jgi:hypothetical protein